MKILTDLIARLLFALPFAVFGLFHFMNAGEMAGAAPFGGTVIIYITGAAMIAAAISILIKKKAALATLLLAVLLILFTLLVHLPGLMDGDENQMGTILRNISLTGAALFFSGVFKAEEEEQV